MPSNEGENIQSKYYKINWERFSDHAVIFSAAEM